MTIKIKELILIVFIIILFSFNFIINETINKLKNDIDCLDRYIEKMQINTNHKILELSDGTQYYNLIDCYGKSWIIVVNSSPRKGVYYSVYQNEAIQQECTTMESNEILKIPFKK